MFSLKLRDTAAIERAIDNFKHLGPWVDLVSLTLSSELTIVRTPLQIHFQVVSWRQYIDFFPVKRRYQHR